MKSRCSCGTPDTTDYGPEPFIADINRMAGQNSCFRQALWTGNHLQMTLMCIPMGEEIGLEAHHLDQYLRVESGCGTVKMGACRDKLNHQQTAYEGCGIFVPAGTWHNLINTGNRPLKLSSVYAPPEHPPGTVHETREAAEKAEHYHFPDIVPEIRGTEAEEDHPPGMRPGIHSL